MTDSRGVSRRGLLAGAGAAAVVGPLVATGSAGAAPAGDAIPVGTAKPGAGGTVRLRAGTDLAAQVSPDGRWIATDVVGVLWVLPASGGTARRLTSDLYDIAQPEWSPDSSTIAFQSYRDGCFNLWTIRPDGKGIRQLTHGPYDHREPRFSPDGRFLAFSSDLSGSYGVYTYDLTTGRVATVADTAAEEYEPAWSPDGTRIAFVVANTAIDVVDTRTGARTNRVTVPAGTILHAPAWTPDGVDLVYTQTTPADSRLMRAGTPLVEGEEVFPFRVSWPTPTQYVYTADGVIRRRSLSGGAAHAIGFTAAVTVVAPRYVKRRRDFDSTGRKQVRGIGSPVLSPDGRQVAFRALNDIWTMRIGARPEPLTRDAFWKSDPAFSPDGRWLSYSSDRAGQLDIWLRDLAAGTDRRLVHLPDAAAVSGSWSPDGRELAFLDHTGALYTVEVSSGDVQRVYPATFEPGRPTWSPDGAVIALAAIKPYSARYREGLSKILLVDRSTGAARYVDPLPDRSIQTRGDDGPVWSPDGRHLAFVVASTLWVLPVHADGTPSGAARQLTREVTDAPSWNGAGTELLYLNNGRLRVVAATGGTPRTVPVNLTWTNSAPRGRTVIHAGRAWDGTGRHLRSDVDIVLDGNRIAAVEPHRAGRDGVRVDASDSVVIPGLIDIHNHREMQGYSYGDRQGRIWLALGITTTRSPGSPAYHMVEDRESVQSGARLAPRYFATGEAIDGGRIFYNFMRPTFDTAQLALELERAEALDYDLMKAYVRLPTEWQRAVIDFAHRHHIPATSHYHYPATAFGGDGMEHVGATNRFGYSRTVTALGSAYSDVTDIFATSGASRSTTLFGAAAMFGTDDSLAVDPRVTTLYPRWELESLRASVTTARGTDQTANLANLANQVAQLLAQLHAGGTVLTGTDSPIDHTAVSTHMNLRAMVRYGFTPYEAMVSATSVPGDYLNEPLGRIEAGRYADLTVLGGDPLQDISQAANVQRVVVNGVAHTVAELYGPFAAAAHAEAAPGNRMLPPVPDHPSNRAYWWHDPHYLAESKRSCCAG